MAIAASPAAEGGGQLGNESTEGARTSGPVKGRSQFVGPGGHYVKRDRATGRIMDVKANKTPFKGVTKEK